MMNKHGGDIYGYPGVVDFSANINYLGMPQAVKAAAMRGVEESVHYPQAAQTIKIRCCKTLSYRRGSDIVR